MLSQAMGFIRRSWLEIIAWALIIPYMIYIWIYYSWEAFIINALTGMIGYMATLYFGHLMPIVGYLLRKWDREKHEHEKSRRGTDKGDS